jgi:three-Cys-motif partner protein
LGVAVAGTGVPNPFSLYVFCERDADSLDALTTRVCRFFPQAKARFVPGDCNEKVDEVTSIVPRGYGVLSLCFADPFDLSLKFSTVRGLASRRMDFLFALAFNMDGIRNIPHYTSPANRKIDEFLGLSDWREKWKEKEAKGTTFPRFLAESFSSQMQTIGYLAMPFHKMKQIRSDGNAPLYHLALFSKNERALAFWDEVLKYSTNQIEFGF